MKLLSSSAHWIFWLFCLVSHSATGQELPTLVADQLKKQAQEPFAEKFELVQQGQNLAQISEQNLSRIQKSMEATRQLSSYLSQAKEMASDTDSHLELRHSTSASSAISILSSGAIFSLDELVRRGIAPAKKKLASPTSGTQDGPIGEQDVVFLALETGKYRNGQAFGEITFVFDKKAILDDPNVYFSPFAFSNGQSIAESSHPDEIKNLDDYKKEVQELIPLYRRFLFQGYNAYTQLLMLASAQRLWQESPANRKKITSLESSLKSNDSEKALEGFCELSQILSQNEAPLANLSPTLIQQLLAFLSGGDAGAKGEPLYFPEQEPQFKVLSAYRGFPDKSSGYPLSLTNNAWFWEVKVPTKLSLDHLESIRFKEVISQYRSGKRKNPQTGSEEIASWYEDIPTTDLQNAISDYATKSHRKVQRIKFPDGALEYRFE